MDDGTFEERGSTWLSELQCGFYKTESGGGTFAVLWIGKNGDYTDGDQRPDVGRILSEQSTGHLPFKSWKCMEAGGGTLAAPAGS